ncbi:MAG: amidohydrolase family protein [Deltaproteobacteria bacterium]|nr:amidohydrolase family protein [Deltaproteobacteria bacterium]
MKVDIHTHIFPAAIRDRREAFFRGDSAFQTLYGAAEAKMVGARQLVQMLDEEGVDPMCSKRWPVIRTASRVFAVFRPWLPVPHLASGAAREAERCLDAGLSGVGELAVYGSDLDPEVIQALSEVMGLCRERNVPVLLHTNEPVGHAYPGKAPISLRGIYAFVKAYPENRVILAHWGGGIFFYGLMKKEVRDVLRNVWLDTAASPFLYTPEVYHLAVQILGSDKILFGSDYPLLRPGRYFREMAGAGLDEKTLSDIRGGNAAAFLGLDG